MKKTITKILSIFLALVMFSAIIPFSGTQTDVSAATPTTADKILAKAKEISEKSPHKYDGYCLAFCGACYMAAGYKNYPVSTAYEAGTKWIVSERDYCIPVGALVFYNYEWNSAAGHVGIYAGNGKMYDAESQYGGVMLRDFQTHGYRGWGWYGGIKPDDSYNSVIGNMFPMLMKLIKILADLVKGMFSFIKIG